MRDVLGCKVRHRAVIFQLPSIPNRRRLDKVVLPNLPRRVCFAVDLDVLEKSMCIGEACNAQEEENVSEPCHCDSLQNVRICWDQQLGRDVQSQHRPISTKFIPEQNHSDVAKSQ